MDQDKSQFSHIPNPCIALFISRQYRMLASVAIDKSQQEDFYINAKLWLDIYMELICNSQARPHRLSVFMQLNELNQLS